MRGLVVVREVEGRSEYLSDVKLGTWTSNPDEACNFSPTDIGLAKARAASELHGGKIEFEQER
ncbi:MAG TPA: hypothetical protein VFF14_01445 [Candidatus Deferrimicrobium sp.]|nr:hypothetical protein [Candidatus Deferrimicrobium sp.]